MTIRILPLAALLVVAGLVLAQPAAKKDAPPKEPPKPAPGSLEDTLDKSLRNSADIKAAEAKVREAEAELNRVRHQVLTKATALHSDLNSAKRMLAVAEQSLTMHEKGLRTGATTTEGLLAVQAMVEKHKGEVEKLEAELKSLRGEFAIKNPAFSPDGRLLYSSSVDGAVRIWDAKDGTLLREVRDAGVVVWDLSHSPAKTPAVPTPMFDRIKKLLEQEVQWKVENADVSHALKSLLQAAKTDIPLRDLVGREGSQAAITLEGTMSVGAWIQAIEDSDPKVRVVARDYGLLLTTRERVPETAMWLQDIWKGRYAELKKPDPKAGEKK
jgi:Outer membrane efflux protein/WD domain, G-beta repeat